MSAGRSPWGMAARCGPLSLLGGSFLLVLGALGISGEMPFSEMMIAAQVMGIADGPTEVHQITVAKQVLRDYEAGDERWPSAHIPTRTAEARKLLGVDK